MIQLALHRVRALLMMPSSLADRDEDGAVIAMRVTVNGKLHVLHEALNRLLELHTVKLIMMHAPLAVIMMRLKY